MATTKPTATTFFASSSTATKTKIQSVLDSIDAGASRDAVLCAVNGLSSQMSAADRDLLVSMAYSRLDGR